MIRTVGFRFVMLFVLAAVAMLSPPHARAQGSREADASQGEQQAADTAPVAIQAPEIARRVAAANERLRELRALVEADPAVVELRERFPELEASLLALAKDPASLDPEGLSRRSLDNLRQRWLSYKTQLDDWAATLAARAETLDGSRGTLAAVRATWEATAQQAEIDEFPDATVAQINSVIEAIGAAEEELRARQEVVLTLQNQVVGESIRITEVLERIDAAREEVRSQVLLQDAPPLWRALVQRRDPAAVAAEVRASWREDESALLRFVDSHRERVIFHAVLFAGLLMLLVGLRGRSANLARDDPALEGAVRALSRPFSAALLIAVLATPAIYRDAPPVVMDIAKFAVLLPVLRLLPGLLPSALRRPLYALGGLYVLDVLQEFTPKESLIQRLLLLLLACLALIGLALMIRRSGWVKEVAEHRWWRWLLTLSRLAVATLAVALLANLLGFASLSDLLTGATLNAGYVAVVFYAGALVLDGLVRILVRTPAARSINAVRRNTGLVTRRGVTLVHVLAVLSWVVAALKMFDLFEPVIAVVGAVLEQPFTVGALSFSLGDILAFAVAIWASLLISRFVRFILEEDVLPRIDLPRGVPNAISKLVHYAIVGFGFFVAIAAAGLELDRFAIIFGALGVGIGFGLQSIVNNFISGLILIFERPIQEGDTIQVGSLLGDVRRIGIRSSTLRTFDGSEVIVPNANLISNEVINWTLSDRHRRVELPVGVAYGTDVRKVLEILKDVASKHPQVLKHPEAQALFRSFGDSSLDFSLRFWAANLDSWMQVSSDVAVAVHDALAEAGIEIPFPQRDLHVRSVDPLVKRAFEGQAGEEPA